VQFYSAAWDKLVAFLKQTDRIVTHKLYDGKPLFR
jgi:hypothetical protein